MFSVSNYVQQMDHQLIHERWKFADIPSSNIAHWPNIFIQ